MHMDERQRLDQALDDISRLQLQLRNAQDVIFRLIHEQSNPMYSPLSHSEADGLVHELYEDS